MADSFFMWACPELDTYKKEFTLFLFFPPRQRLRSTTASTRAGYSGVFLSDVIFQPFPLSGGLRGAPPAG
jgi:hypothetical protein